MSDQPQYPSYPGPEEPSAPQPPPAYGQQPPVYGQPAYGQQPPAYGQAPYGQAGYGQPAYGQPDYGQPAYGQPTYGYPVRPTQNGKALWSMIAGIVSIVFCVLGLFIGPAAIVLSVIGKREIVASQGRQTGAGMATAGLVTGIIGTVIWAAYICLVAIGIAVD